MISQEPINLGVFPLNPSEYQYIQYMPIGMRFRHGYFIPDNLKWMERLLENVHATLYDYVYVTSKYVWVNSNTHQNREGWHIDGFLTDDVNYIWYDSSPTEFCIQEFNLSDDHEKSMIEMEEQAKPENIKTYPANTLLRLDNTIVHRTPLIETSGFRSFVKISVSKEKYALKGNAKNPLIDYDWDMIERHTTRNCPQSK